MGFGGENPGRRRVGASPSEVYSYLQQEIKNNPAVFKDALINLSTGVSNNPSDFSSIKNQLDLLSSAGARVNIIGAAQGRYDKQNKQLEDLSKSYGFNFLGGFKPGPDLVHPATYGSYNGLQLDKVFTPVQSTVIGEVPPQETTEDKVVKVLAKYKGIAGELNKTTGEFKEREWSPEELKRYEYYKNLGK